MQKVKSTKELEDTIAYYKAYLSDVVDVMVDSSLYIKKSLRSSLNDVVELYYNNSIDAKKLSLDKNKKLDRDVSAIIALLNEKINLYKQSVKANDIYG